MEFGLKASPAGASDADIIKDSTTASFAKDVIEASRAVPVIVDFWAAWCGPCKQLTPVLEKVVKSYGGKVRLVKVNVDEHPGIAGQLRVQSLPTVYAFRDGRPLDGFMGAQPESAIRAFVDRLVGEEAEADVATVLGDRRAGVGGRRRASRGRNLRGRPAGAQAKSSSPRRPRPLLSADRRYRSRRADDRPGAAGGEEGRRRRAGEGRAGAGAQSAEGRSAGRARAKARG